jgi:hypothetical protein
LKFVILQTNFKKYASGGGFVSKDLAKKIVEAGPQNAYPNGSSPKARMINAEF